MKIRCSLAACAVALFAALLFACPLTARAEDSTGSGLDPVIELSQDDFLNEDGSYRVYELSASRSYKLTEDVYGAIYMRDVLDHPSELTVLELDGHTITTPASLDVPTVNIAGVFAYLSIMNGSIVQEGTGHPAIFQDSPFATINLDLGDEHSITSNNNVCVESYGAEKFMIRSGTYIVNNNTSNSPVLYSGSGDYMYVYGGTFIAHGGTEVIYVKPETISNPGHIRILEPCTFNQYPAGASIETEGLSLVCKKYEKGADGSVEASFVVEETPTDYRVLGGLVKNQSGLGTVYFENHTDYEAFLTDHEVAKENLDPLVYTVTFSSLGGTEVASQTLHWGDKVTRPNNPEKKNFAFDCWLAVPEQTAYDFENSIVTSDMTLMARWTRKGRPAVGEEDSSNAGESVGEGEDEKTASLISTATKATGSLPQTGDASALVALVAAAGAGSAAVGVFRRRR